MTTLPSIRIPLLRLALWLGWPRLVAWTAWRLGITREERDGLSAAEAARRGLASLLNLRCPLCGTEIRGAWTVTADGQLGARRASVCPTCDFRLDSCRHCRHFRPGGAAGAAVNSGMMVRVGDEDFTQGGCEVYRGYASVYDLYGEKMADRLAMMGAESIRVPKPITDSYVPLPECTAFALAPRRLRHSDTRLDRTWRAWLRWLSNSG